MDVTAPVSNDLSVAARTRRTAMVARLDSDGVLTDPMLREALLHVSRELLLPHAYVRESGPGIEPIQWRLLDGAHGDDQDEWLDLVYSVESVLLQRDGELLDVLKRGPHSGGRMTSMSTNTLLTVEALQTLRPAPGLRYLDLGTGPAVSLAYAAALTGPGHSVGVEKDPYVAAFAQLNLDRAGVEATVAAGDALNGHAAGAPYDLMHSGIGVPSIPSAWVQQLAPGGRLLTTLATRTPSWPGQLLVTRTPDGRIEAALWGGPRGHRPLHGYSWPTAVHHRPRIAATPGRPRATRLAPPPDDAHGFWLAAAYLAPGLVRDFQAETMTIVAPEDDSWAVTDPDGTTVRTHGQRDVWAELEDVHARWILAGRPDTYRVELADQGGAPQHVISGPGVNALEWVLPPLPAPPDARTRAVKGAL